MFVLEEYKWNYLTKKKEWAFYAVHYSEKLLEKMIATKKHPEKFRIRECDMCAEM